MCHQTFELLIIHMVLLVQLMIPLHLKGLLLSNTLSGFLKVMSLPGVTQHIPSPLRLFQCTKTCVTPSRECNV